MPLHFSAAEFDRRRDAVRASMADQGLDALLVFKQESMFWLTGYDTFGFCFFQCLVVPAKGEPVLVTRSADLRQAQLTSNIQDIRIWVDRDGADPASTDLRPVLEELGLRGRRVGVEFDTHGLTYRNGKRLEAALEGFATLEEASLLLSKIRLVKSVEELVYVREAAKLGDAALDAAVAATHAGADEGVILARMHDAIFEGGGDYPGNPFIIGSGPQALLCRYYTGRRKLDARDQLTLEFAGVYRQYHAALMRTLLVGEPDDDHRRMFDAAKEALLTAEAALVPGRTMGEVFDAQAAVLDRHGMRAHRLNATGYSLGAVYAPSWMDWPMFYTGNPVVMAPGMTFFIHIILMNSETGRAMTLARTSLVTEGKAEPLAKAPLEMIVR
ncbi:M24 family metallopeptidase [Geminicoccus roseus]|uniref:M24 family metallopeptidase n=1 Tax=Geminicoccus roseus TaxID=404900 RepID=UPI0004858227|nr:Xaa-Pro peptidase family protein [Geminicoccus roseus]